MFHTFRPTHVPAALAAALLLFAASIAPAQTFVHPGALSTQADFTRMSNNVAAGAHPWIDDYNKMIASPVASLSWPFNPVTQISRGIAGQNNYVHSQEDAQNIYFCALRWRITGDTNYANRAIVGMDAWSSTMTNGVGGNSNFALAAGLCGYEFACAGEELRGYSGWSQASMNAYSNFLMIFYGSCEYFLTQHNGTCGSHYRCNWDACNIAAILAIGVFCDNRAIFNEGIGYYTNGVGNGNIERAVDFVHPDGLGQEEESGRDQAHCMDGINGLSTFCQVAWNQGVDMYGYDNNRYLRALEYVAKCNIYGNSWIPYVHHTVCDMTYDEDTLAGAPIGAAEYFWETPFAHYANIKGISAPFTGAAAASVRPDGGIYNWNSPDWFGYSTLISYLGPVTNSAPSPSGLVATVSGRQITLNWWGTSLATSYNVKRATSHGGPYTTIAVTAPNALSYVDVGLTSGTTYYYVVSASQPGGETANSAELVASPNDVISGIVIGSPGAYNNAKRTIVNVFDGSFESFYDALNTTGDWAGIDPGLGVSSVGSVITRIEYAPRKGYATRMVGGQFQGALAGDPNFTSPVTLYTVPTVPTDGFITAQNGVLTSATINNPTAFRYLRYIGPASANCDVSEVVFHGTATGLTAPAAPVNVAASVPWYGSEVDLSWSASAGATSYTIKRATNSGGPYMVLENVSGFKELTAINSITNYTDYSVTAGGAYYYVITALNSAGETNSSHLSAGTPVVGLTAAPGDNQVALNWTASPGATSYNVKRGTVSGGPYTTIASPTNTSYTDTTAVNGTTYIYVVSANQPGGESANSGEVIATPTSIIASNYGFESPATSTYIYNPSGASWTFSTSSGVSANSSAFTSGNSAAPEGTQVALLQSIASISQTISGFSPGTIYTVTFAASQRQNKSGGQAGQTFNVQIDGVTVGSFAPSQAVSYYPDYSTNFTASATNHTLAFVGTDLNGGDNTVFLDNVRIAPLPLPPVPMGLAATAISTDQINLSWPASPGAMSYNVKRTTVSGGPYTTVATGVTATTYYDAGLSGSTIYYYVISAVNAYGEGGNSTQVSATTLGGAPTGLTATAGNAQVALSWNAFSDATSYNVKRATVSGGPYTTIASPTGPSYTDTTVVNGTTYYYVVSAVNDSDESDDSPQVSVMTPLIWSGAVNTNWDTTTLNWVTGAAATYQDGVPVQFDDTALSNTTVSVVATVTPASVVFYNSVKNYTISGSSIAGACNLTLFGNGTVTLSGANTFTNTTTINAGTLTLANSLALQNSTLNYSNGSLTFNGITAATLGGLSGTANLSLLNGASAAVALTAGGNGFSTSYSGTLSGSGSLIKNGASTLTLSGNNSYTGASTINAGTLALSGNNSFTGGISIGSTAKLQLQASSGNTTAGVSSVMPAQNMTLAQLPSGATIQLRADSSTASSGVAAFDNGATAFGVDTSGQRLNGTLNFDVNQLTIGSTPTTLQFGSTSAVWTVGTGTTTFNVTGGTGYSLQLGSLKVGNNISLVFNPTTANMIVGTLANASTGGVTKNGAGTLTLSGNNTYTGVSTINTGTLAFSGNNSARPSNANGKTVVNSGGILQLQANAGNTSGGISTALSPETTANGPLTLNNGSTVQLRGDTNVTFAGGNSLGGVGSATITLDVNQLTSAGTNNTLTLAPGGFSVLITTLNVTGGNGCTLALGVLTDVNFQANANATTINPTTANVTIAGLGGSTAWLHTFILGGTSTGNMVTGPIANSSGTTTITKTGSGTWTIPAANTYSGATTVSNGELIVATVFTGGGSFVVADGAALGVTSKSTTSATIGSLALGVSGPTTLEFQNVTNLTTALISATALTLNGSCTVKITGTNNLVAGNTYPLINYSGSFTGNFTNFQLQMPSGFSGVLTNLSNQVALQVLATVPTTPTNLNYSMANGSMQLSWPLNYNGWTLQMQTNLLGTNWVNVPGTGSTNSISIPLTNNSMFFRLVYP